MTNPSIPDRAAVLVNMRSEAEAAIAKVRDLDGDWQSYHLLAHDVLNGTHEHLQHAYQMLGRVRDMADNEAARLKNGRD
ncbi:hypothetical protein D3C86_1784350 [compost metagenome]